MNNPFWIFLIVSVIGAVLGGMTFDYIRLLRAHCSKCRWWQSLNGTEGICRQQTAPFSEILTREEIKGSTPNVWSKCGPNMARFEH